MQANTEYMSRVAGRVSEARQSNKIKNTPWSHNCYVLIFVLISYYKFVTEDDRRRYLFGIAATLNTLLIE
jgi:hypothetical protein